jgi:hypothetical protein
MKYKFTLLLFVAFAGLSATTKQQSKGYGAAFLFG